MKTAIVYYSKHHGNTKKLLDAIAAAADVDLIDVTAMKTVDLSGYNRIGFASGIYYGAFAKQIQASAADYFEKWHGNARFSAEIRESRKVIKRTIRHADVLMACVRVFSEY